ncbi:hypothetical protein N8873_04980 [Flavobacteriaceae bacterium]|jgi:hypothetical protein|nr:hypothetical protein [Flavobacteriaceae bacterium]MDA7711400.1 hypothetical protein [Flavobacteriaceae bacterium]
MVKKYVVSFFLLTSLIVSAQSGSVSPYSFSGLGEVNFRGTHANRTMGGVEVFTDSIHLNLLNPGSYGDLKFTTYSLGVNYKLNNFAATDVSNARATANLDYLAIGVPAGIFGFGFGVVPYSSVGYRVETRALTDAGVNSINRFEGEGGLNQAFVSVGIPFLKYFNVGATINYGFGNVLNQTAQIIEGITNGSYLSNQSSISGLSYNLSANVNIPLFKKYYFKGMYALQPEAGLTSRNLQTFFTQSIDGGSLVDFEEINLAATGDDITSINLTKTNRIGIGFGQSSKWFLGAQLNYINSSNFKNEFFQQKNISYQDARQISVGGFYIPQYNSFSSYWKRVVYRFGLRSEKSSLVINNIPLTENGISFGMGLPMRGLSNANVGIEIGQRGEKSSQQFKESYFSLRIGLSLNDKWFIKRKFN